MVAPGRYDSWTILCSRSRSACNEKDVLPYLAGASDRGHIPAGYFVSAFS